MTALKEEERGSVGEHLYFFPEGENVFIKTCWIRRRVTQGENVQR